jgi:uncharacterized membrane protein YkvA (DUF1232 family)
MTPSPQLDDTSFWDTIRKYASKIGREVVEQALSMYYALQDPDTPVWAKSIIIGGLIYLISPVDAVPDVIPVVGLTDDIAVLAGALATVAMHIKPEHKAEAVAKAAEWFN